MLSMFAKFLMPMARCPGSVLPNQQLGTPSSLQGQPQEVFALQLRSPRRNGSAEASHNSGNPPKAHDAPTEPD